MGDTKKGLGPSVIVSFDEKEHPAFFVANYRHIKEKFGHLALYDMMERAGIKEGETVPLFAQWPDAEGVTWFDTPDEAKAMREIILKNISQKTTCKDLRIVPLSVFTNRFFAECLFGEAWESAYWLHRHFRKWKSKGHFRRIVLLKLREAARLSKSRQRSILMRDGRYSPLADYMESFHKK